MLDETTVVRDTDYRPMVLQGFLVDITAGIEGAAPLSALPPTRRLRPRPVSDLALAPRRPAALVRADAAVGDLEDPVGDPVEEVPVVRDEDRGAVEVLERQLEHLHRLDVEVVRRLVEQQAVRPLQHQQQQLQPCPLAARQRCRAACRTCS